MRATQESHPKTYPVLSDKLRSLRAVVAVHDEGAAGRAAEVLHLSQSAVTRAILELEQSLGFPLFDRSSRGMSTTEAGSLLANRARRAFNELANGHHDSMRVAPKVSRAAPTPERFANTVASRSLECLIGIADHGSEPRVSAKLGVTQPTVHRSLEDIERLSGVSLFSRTPRGTRLTESGEALLRGVKLALAEIANAEDELAAFGGQLRGRVVIGALPLSSSFLVPHAVEHLMTLHPELQITIIDGTYDSLIHQLRCADIDLIVGALRTQPANSDITQNLLFKDTLAVIARTNHPITRSPLKNGLADLLDCAWVVPLPETPSRASFEGTFHAEGLAPPVALLQVNSPSVVRSLLLHSDRLALVSPLQAAPEIRSGVLVRLPIDLQKTSRDIGVAMRRDGAPSPATLALLESLRAAVDLMQASATGSAKVA